MPGVRIYDAAKYRDDPKAIAQYLNDALSTEDPFLITRAVGTMVRAQGITRLSRKAGMRRDSLHKMFTGEVSPAFDSVMKLLIGHLYSNRSAVTDVAAIELPLGFKFLISAEDWGSRP